MIPFLNTNEVLMMKREYIKPEIEKIAITNTDILNGSDVLVDGSDLFATEQ